MIFLQYKIIIYMVTVLGLLLIILMLISLLEAIFKKNKNLASIKINEDNFIEKYFHDLYQLIEIKTTSFHDESGYHLFREKLKEIFPLIHKYFIKEKIDGNAIFSYKNQNDNSPNVLFATHIDYNNTNHETKFCDNQIYGNGTFDSKSLLYVMFEAVEETLRKDQKLPINLTITMTTDDETTKEGSSHIVDQFLRKGNFFDLVLEEGSGIISPSVFGIKNYFALVGIGVSGEAIIRFRTKKSNEGMKRIHNFINVLQNGNLYKSKIDSKTRLAIKQISKDMKFTHRFFFTNFFMFNKICNRIIDKEYKEISKLLKTTVNISDYQENEDEIYTDVTFELAVHETFADVILAIAKYMEKYEIEYQIIRNKEASRVTDIRLNGYKIVKKAINAIYKKIFIAPIIITKISEKRYFDKVSDCVIRFSPLYYDNEAYQDAFKGNEHIKVSSLPFGVNFFEYIIKNFKRNI